MMQRVGVEVCVCVSVYNHNPYAEPYTQNRRLVGHSITGGQGRHAGGTGHRAWPGADSWNVRRTTGPVALWFHPRIPAAREGVRRRARVWPRESPSDVEERWEGRGKGAPLESDMPASSDEVAC